MRAAIYERVSTPRQIEGYSLDSQESLLRDYCDRQGWQAVGTYVDAGISGRKDRGQRPELDRLLRDVEAGAVDAIVVYKLDRLSRKPLHMYQMLETLDRRKAGIVSITEAIDSRTSTGRMMLGMFVSLAEKFWEDLQERTRHARLQKARTGKAHPHANTLYGYRYDRQTQQHLVEPQEAAVVRRMFEQYAQGYSPARIASLLNAEGIPTSKASLVGWDHRKISEMMTRSEYHGEGWSNRYYGDVERKRLGLSGRAMRPQSEWIPVPYPTIIERELFERAQQQRERNKRKASLNRARPEYLLLGLLHCSECGKRFEAQTKFTGGKLYRYYQCGGMRHQPHHYRCRGQRNLSAERVEQAVWGSVNDSLADPDHLRAKLREEYGVAVAEARGVQVEWERVQRQLNNLDQEKGRYLTLYGKGKISEAEYDRKITTVNEQMEPLVEQAQRYAPMRRAAVDLTVLEEEAWVRTIRYYGEMGETEPRTVIQQLVAAVRVDSSSNVTTELIIPRSQALEHVYAPGLH